MGENCRDCLYAKNFEKDITELKDSVKNLDGRTSDLERRSDVERERTDMIFNILNEIKDSINKIASKIEDIENRPNHIWWTVLGAIAVAVVMAGVKQIGA